MAKSQSTAEQQDGGAVLAILEGRSCPSCGGELERDVYKDKDAVVCAECGTPRAQVWTPS
ncbi:HVO_A0556 family zinc finger protein [Halopiger xanaduensis]|uniref:Small CPxCG-related zinc finger protein n=1 Tax=Halopiger xanaduensis (strain DSM 18323 / JCM 14033 / SH-6) TaxID=797210 RepID=F8DAY1_HALXS|nr:HVO_A0556 family zinc finger protein [Halopiger xanaduensis]AEH38222.1 hypothetical protein Halxa_3613 [Halopiger xanaduensis SH-6]